MQYLSFSFTAVIGYSPSTSSDHWSRIIAEHVTCLRIQISDKELSPTVSSDSSKFFKEWLQLRKTVKMVYSRSAHTPKIIFFYDETHLVQVQEKMSPDFVRYLATPILYTKAIHTNIPLT